MKLEDFLRVKKVKCVDNTNMALTKNKHYQLLGLTVRSALVYNDNGDEAWVWMSRFEPVLDDDLKSEQEIYTKENSMDKSTNTNEQKFKVGDRVYVGLTGKIAKVTRIVNDYVYVANGNNQIETWIPVVWHATQENYDALCKLYPNIKFETLDNSKFKIGDKVYCPSMLDGYIYVVKDNQATLLPLFVSNDHEDCYSFNTDGINEHNNPIVYHATEENCKALQVLHPDIEFETPPKEL